MPLEQSNTTFSTTQLTSTRLSQVTSIRRLLSYAGLNFRGLVCLNMTKTSPNSLTIDITPTDLCARSSDMEVTTADNPLPSPNNPASQSPSSSNSNPNTSLPSPHIELGNSGLPRQFLESAISQLLQAVNAGSTADVMIPAPYVKPLLTILKEVSQIL